MFGETLLGGAIVLRAQRVFVDMLWSKVSDRLRSRLTLSKDKLKTAMEVALIYALERTVQQHLYFDSDLFLGNLFERLDTALVDRLLSHENYPTALELAQVWANNLANTPDSERSRSAEAMTPQCATFLQEFRRALIHTRLFQSDRVMADLLALDKGETGITLPTPSTQALTALEKQLAGWVENVTDAYQNLSATLSQWMQRRWTRGLHQIPTDYTSELKNFLYEYLGGPKRTVPFGGRQADLDYLTGWLDDPLMPQRLLIATEAGRGKSALLVRWCAQLQLRGDTHIVFIPISLRFGTAAPDIYFSMLAARLAVIRGETIQHIQLNGAQWKAVCNNYLAQLSDDDRVLIVLDGLDESLDPHVIDKSLVPRSLPKRVKVVVSARTQTDRNETEWLRALGWDIGILGRSTTLLPLSENGVRNVLESMGNPLNNLAKRDVVFQALYRLTEGDPLLVGLYIDALASKGGQVASITLEELAQIEPGLEGYFAQWWEDQQKQWEIKGTNPLTRPEIEDFFYTLATARGPITKVELQQVLTGTTGPRLTLMAQEVKRFIVGDGTASGYAFNHPRLGYYFLERLSDIDKVEKHQKYVEYGEKILQELGNATSGMLQRHPYVLQYYIYHLEITNAPAEKYYALLCQEWAEAWLALRGTYDGFLASVETIRFYAEKDPDIVQSLIIQIWCALCKSSIITLSSNIPPKLLVGATKAGVLDKKQSLVLLKQNNKISNISESVARLADANANDRIYLELLLNTAYTPNSSLFPPLVLMALSSHIPEIVLEKARLLENSLNKALLLIELADYLPHLQPQPIYQEALSIIQKFDIHWLDTSIFVKVLISLMPYFPLAVLEIVKNLPNEIIFIQVAIGITPHLPAEQREELLQDALVISQSHDPSYRIEVLLAIALHRDPSENVDIYKEALRLAYSIKGEWQRIKNLTEISMRLPTLERNLIYEEIRKLMSVIKSDYDQAFAYFLCDLAPNLPDLVLENFYRLEDQLCRAEVLAALAPFMPHKVLSVMNVLQDSQSRATVLVAVAPCLPLQLQASLFEEALTISRDLQSTNIKFSVEILTTIADYMPKLQNELYREALALTRYLQDTNERVKSLSTLVSYIPKEVLKTVITIPDEKSLAHLLIALAKFEPQNVLQLSAILGNSDFRCDVLVALVPFLPQDILPAVFMLPDYFRKKRSKILVALAPYIPQDILEQVVELSKDNTSSGVIEILEALSPYKPQQVLRLVREINKDWPITRVLIALAPYIPQAVVNEMSRLPNPHDREAVLIAVAPYFSTLLQSEIYEESLRIAQSLQHSYTLSYAVQNLITLTECLSPINRNKIYEEALNALLLLEDTWLNDPTKKIISLAPYMPHKILEISKHLSNNDSRAVLLSALAEHLPEPIRREIYDEVLSILPTLKNFWAVTDILCNIAPHLPQEVFQVAKELNGFDESKVFSALAPYLPQRILEVTLKLEDTLTRHRANVLHALSTHIPQDVLPLINSINEPEDRASILTELLPYLVELTVKEPYKAKLEWQKLLQGSMHSSRANLLNIIQSLTPFTMALAYTAYVQDKSYFHQPDLSRTQYQQLFTYLQDLNLTSHSERIFFLDQLGIPIAMRNKIQFDIPQDAFLQNLLTNLANAGHSLMGESYFFILLRYLHDVEWVGHQERQEFLAEALGTSNVMQTQKRLAEGILEAIQSVCKWWP